MIFFTKAHTYVPYSKLPIGWFAARGAVALWIKNHCFFLQIRNCYPLSPLGLPYASRNFSYFSPQKKINTARSYPGTFDACLVYK